VTDAAIAEAGAGSSPRRNVRSSRSCPSTRVLAGVSSMTRLVQKRHRSPPGPESRAHAEQMCLRTRTLDSLTKGPNAVGLAAEVVAASDFVDYHVGRDVTIVKPTPAPRTPGPRHSDWHPTRRAAWIWSSGWSMCEVRTWWVPHAQVKDGKPRVRLPQPHQDGPDPRGTEGSLTVDGSVRRTRTGTPRVGSRRIHRASGPGTDPGQGHACEGSFRLESSAGELIADITAV